jgi:hypothetical protein
MSLDDFITIVFCLTDDALQLILNGGKLRQKGFQPALPTVRALQWK